MGFDDFMAGNYREMDDSQLCSLYGYKISQLERFGVKPQKNQIIDPRRTPRPNLITVLLGLNKQIIRQRDKLQKV